MTLADRIENEARELASLDNEIAELRRKIDEAPCYGAYVAVLSGELLALTKRRAAIARSLEQ